MSEIQRAVEHSIGVLFDDYSVHPAGRITALAKGHQVVLSPTRQDGDLTGWTYTFIDPDGNTTVAADRTGYEARMIHKIMKWRWSL